MKALAILLALALIVAADRLQVDTTVTTLKNPPVEDRKATAEKVPDEYVDELLKNMKQFKKSKQLSTSETNQTQTQSGKLAESIKDSQNTEFMLSQQYKKTFQPPPYSTHVDLQYFWYFIYAIMIMGLILMIRFIFIETIKTEQKNAIQNSEESQKLTPI